MDPVPDEMRSNSTNLSQRNGAARRTVVFGKDRIRIEDGESAAVISARLPGSARTAVPMLRTDRHQNHDIEQIVRLHHAGLLPCPPPVDVHRRYA